MRWKNCGTLSAVNRRLEFRGIKTVHFIRIRHKNPVPFFWMRFAAESTEMDFRDDDDETENEKMF